MSKKTKTTALVLMLIILTSKITGFFRDIVLAQTFGAGEITDAYLTALNIPVVLFDGISAALGTTFIPIYFKIKSSKGQEEVNKFTSNILNIVILVSLVFVLLGVIFAPYIVKIFAVGFKGDVFDLTVNYSKILIFSMVFIAINGLVSSYLVASGNVYISGAITIPFNIFVIIAIIFASVTESYVMVYGTLIAYIAQLLFQLPLLIKKGYKHRLTVNLRDENIRQILFLVIPVFIGSYINQINAVVNRTLASTLDSGSITALNYANKLNMFAVGVIAVAISTIMYPILSKLASEGNKKLFKINISKSINMIVIIMLPIMVVMTTFSKEIVKVLFEEGSFNSHDTYLTSTALFFYSIGILSYGLKELLAKSFYSLQDTKTPVRNATISVVINIVFSIILVNIMGIGGLALASSISATVTTMLLLISLRKKIGKIGFSYILKTFIKGAIASIVMYIIMRIAYNYIFIYGSRFALESRKFIAFNCFISVILGMSTYLIVVLALKVKEVKEIFDAILFKLKNYFI
ncbi:murein biosynthesis integral membrane protein MurJ [Romboutsia timonensis]|uniref:murein biosynthesis integral membrane protein MurJ n=1 Tax=Romboutsia timonensis TaxID=1776391 RepID=UPI0008DA3093|nr:murein biosynthesis integral membrane protein MurJ [Romboutsia timonensis]